MTGATVHWRFVFSEIVYRWKRSVLFIGGIALAVVIVVALDIMGRAFAELATAPFRELGADLIVQRSATQSAVPKEMGIILPFSAEPITSEELARLGHEPSVTQSAGFVLLWNLGRGSFFSISGIPLGPQVPRIGPGKVQDWLTEGRLPVPGTRQVVVERHYGAFYRLKPGSTVQIAGQAYAVVGVAEIKEGSQIIASNFYLDIDEARRLAHLPPHLVNQVFLKLSDIAETETVKRHIASWMRNVSVTSPGTMLRLFGGVSQTIGRFRSVAVAAGAAAALALSATLVFGNLVERRRDFALLRVVGWTRNQVRRQVAAEIGLQGLLGALLALGLMALAVGLSAGIVVPMPSSLAGENPASFAAGEFHQAATAMALPISTTLWDWLVPPVATALATGIWGWWMSAHLKSQTLWAAIKAG